MPGSATQRSTTIRNRHRAAIRRLKPSCGICGGDIDYTLPHLDPGEFVVDHIIPLAKGGTDDLDNKQAAHRSCNETKGAKLDGQPATSPGGPRVFVTHRAW